MKTSKLAVWGFLLLATPVVAPAASQLPNLDATLKAQRKLVDAHPNDAVAHNDLGNLLEESGDLLGAELAYQKAIELDSQAAAAHFNLALLYQQQKKDRKAIQTLEDLIELDPGHAWAHYQLGVLFEKKGRRNAAIEQYAQAFALDTGLSFPRNNPQILDSGLATESLLRAESFLRTSENRVPRQFNDAARIRKMMLTAPPKEGAAAKEAAAVEEGTIVAPEEGVVRQRAASSSAVLPSSAGAPDEPATRVLTNDDLQGGGGAAAGRNSRARSAATSSPRGGSSTFVAPTAPVYAAPVQKGAPNAGTPPRANDGSLPPAGGYIPPATYDPLERPPAGAPTNTPVAPDRFRPSRRSTASLGWQLEPSGGTGAG